MGYTVKKNRFSRPKQYRLDLSSFLAHKIVDNESYVMKCGQVEIVERRFI